ncbi:hypothetical protein Acsp07_13630 [Actinomycetospora sp. NBRC 106378]|nr:hypothetical protein Acsp07_13630 [Actinomycetospora sp. NBRC 106378]
MQRSSVTSGSSGDPAARTEQRRVVDGVCEEGDRQTTVRPSAPDHRIASSTMVPISGRAAVMLSFAPERASW